MTEWPEFKYRGARAVVMLHEEELRRLVAVWREAKASGVSLPKVDRPDYASFDALLEHILRWSRTYIVWACEQLDIPEPGIQPAPDVDGVDAVSENYLDHLLDGWRTALREVPAERFFGDVYPAPWGTPYCIDAMLEHAVMHAVRHRFQLEELMGDD